MKTDERKFSLDDLPGDDWEVRFTKQVVRNVARYRDLRGLTTEQLAAGCSEVFGEPGKVKGNTLNGLFAGKRKNIGIAELLVFAQALNVPPIALVLPMDNSDVVISPKQFGAASAFHAYLWFNGESAPDSSPSSEEFFAASAPLRWVRAATDQMRKVIQMNYEMIALDRAENKTGIRETRYTTDFDLESAIEALAMLRQRLNEKSISAPALPDWLSFVDREPLLVPSLPIVAGLSASALAWIEARTERDVLDLIEMDSQHEAQAAYEKSDEYRAILKDEAEVRESIDKLSQDPYEPPA
ncbi:hypothetical protein E3T54_03485 [Cryobacterium sp. Sr8]|uniref:hypothetical protein n=1 Tax=Cryobacterium sp. Sr8 TaxID=1259203 RepID=UPI00106C63AE|nr:hypothetical protein [Cryobacterium sp. Sr8]TFD80303.1 hypothetical protein E3T54_03485 [Cryobacterium sp. Sr8]